VKPRLTVYIAAPPRHWRAMWNIYGTQIIGAALQVGSKVVSLQWRRPRHPYAPDGEVAS
jgi:hypothetical protein